MRRGSDFGLGFAQTGNPIPLLPVSPFFQDLQPFKSFEDIPFAAQGGRGAQTTML